MRSLKFALILAPLLACGPQTTATTTETGSGSSSTAATETATTTTSTGPVTTSGESHSASVGTTLVPTTSSSGATVATTEVTITTGATTTEGTTGAIDLTCPVPDGDYGDCATPLGWAWDGEACTSRSGCDCAPDCDKFFPDVVSCATKCAANGACNADRFEAAGLADDPVQEGSFCDGVYVCPGDDAVEQALKVIFGMLSCEPGGFPCDNGEVCAGFWQGSIGPDDWQKMCAASLIPNSGSIFCVVFGP